MKDKNKGSWKQLSENTVVVMFDAGFSGFGIGKTLIPKSLYSFFNIVDKKDVHLSILIDGKYFQANINCDTYLNNKDPGIAFGYHFCRYVDDKGITFEWDNKHFSNAFNLTFFKTHQKIKGPILFYKLSWGGRGIGEGSRKAECDLYKVKLDIDFDAEKKLTGPNYADYIDDYFPKFPEKDSPPEIESPFKNIGPFDAAIHTQKKSSSEMTFGHIEGIDEGLTFTNRKELGLSGIHAPPQAGIWGRQNEGSTSIVLSGGYADDIDDGDYILYTGQGGQDKPGGKQVKNQEFTLGNRGLQLNKEYNLPVRVTRRYQVVKGGVEWRYRYDGLYYVTDYERVKGEEGFQICRFHLQKENITFVEGIEEPTSSADRVPYSGDRLKRNVKFAEQIKKLYNNTCQVCNIFLKTPINGFGVSEAAHIKAIGRPHNGLDTKANMFCLCPNHHAQFDRYSFYINPDNFEIVGLDDFEGKFITPMKHRIKAEYFEYQKQQYLKKN